MRREHDLLAICLLMFTLALTAAMATDPKGFSVQAWQPLMASIVALGGASIVYRGATLAYQAAMAKVGLDREQGERERNSERLGLFLRLTTILYAVVGQTGGCIYLINKLQSEIPAAGLSVTPRQLRVSNPPEVADAWEKIHLLPSELITDIAVLKEMLARVEEELIHFKDETWTIEFPNAQTGDTHARRVPDFLTTFSKHCETIQDCSTCVIHTLEELIPALRKFN